jgi:hypothetical protein
MFIAPDERDDRARTEEGMEYTERRGYRYVAFLRDWDHVLDLIRQRWFSAVVFPGRTHRHVGAANEPDPAAEDTQALSRPAAVIQAAREQRSIYETGRLLPRGDDGGFAERFLKDRRSS